MNLTDLLKGAAGGDGFGALARQYGATPDQAMGVAQTALPTLSAGLKRMAESPDGLMQLAGMFRDTDAEAVADAPDAAPEAAAATGGKFLDTLFGDARPQIEQELAARGAERSGLDPSAVGSMLPMIASMILGRFQKSESADEGGLGSLVGGLLEGGGASGGGGALGGLGGLVGAVSGVLGGGSGSSGGLAAMTAMFDADGDGSITDDLLERFMGR